MEKLSLEIKTSVVFFSAVLLAAMALAATSISFFVRDPATASYDLNATVPPDALFFKDSLDKPSTEAIYYQFDSDNGYDFYCHFVFVDMGWLGSRYVVDYKLHYPDGTYKVFGGQFEKEKGALARDQFK